MKRPRILRRIADILRERNNELAKLGTFNVGRAYSKASTVDVATGADVLEYYIGLIPVLEGNQIPLRETSLVYIRREPLGIAAETGARNYPIQIVLWKSAPALVADNTMILKPSEVTPFIVLKLVEIYSGAGLPNGVFDVLLDIGVGTGQYLTDHPGIVKTLFTGGVASGKEVMANSAASSLEEVAMESDGKSPLIVFDDVDLDLAADVTMIANFFSSGQVYTNGTCVFVPTKYKAVFERKILARVERIHAGNVFGSQISFDPLVSFPHRDNVPRYTAEGIEEDARVLCGGDALKGNSFNNGAWVTPTVFTDCSDGMTTVREETFGPVVFILTYKLEDEAIRRANDTGYSLVAGIVTADLNLTHRVIHQLKVGIYQINIWGRSPVEMSVGGYEYSGVGRGNGVTTLQSYIQMKSIQVEMAKLQSIF